MEEASLYSESLIYIIMLVSVLLSALCSTLEATLLSTPISFITGLEEQGVKGATRLKRLKQHPDRPISAILCLNTIANTVGASIVGSLVYEVYGDALVGIFSTVFTFAILIFAEIIPKTIGTSYWRSLAIPASVIINAMIFISFPLVWILERMQRLISSHSTQVSVSREDISAMVIPGVEVFHQCQITAGEHNSKYYRYLERWELIDRYAELLMSMKA
jgi:Mg2+/Co2+ transporter CorB